MCRPGFAEPPESCDLRPSAAAAKVHSAPSDQPSSPNHRRRSSRSVTVIRYVYLVKTL